MPRAKKTTICPLGGAGVGGKWMFWIMYYLLTGPRRFSELQRLLPAASRQMLTLQLRQLERMGMLHRHVYVQMPPKVEYELSALGRSQEPILRNLEAWGKWYSSQMGQEHDWLTKLGERWKVWILHQLFSGNKSFGELQQLLVPISNRVLALQLRELEQMGLLHRHRTSQGSPKTEYSLTELGQQSEPLFRQLYTWGKWISEQIDVEFDWLVNDQPEERQDSRN